MSISHDYENVCIEKLLMVFLLNPTEHPSPCYLLCLVAGLRVGKDWGLCVVSRDCVWSVGTVCGQ